MILPRWILSLILLLSLSLSVARASERHALLIMVADYPLGSGWPALSAHNDERLLTKTLRSQGFGRIATLADAEATAAKIRRALRALVATTHEGDVVVVAFSGHGQQLHDWSHDEADGLDEALVAYDAPRGADYQKYRGERHILDDEIGAFVQQMKARLGDRGQLLLLLDCCHAGTGARTGAQARLRGGAEPIAPPGSFEAEADGSGFDDGDFGTRGVGAAFVLLTGAAASQQNYEVKDEAGTPFGALSYGFCEGVDRLRTHDSYENLFRNITNVLSHKAPYQTPTIEGDASKLVFAGVLLKQATGFEALYEKSVDYCRRVRLATGELAGVFVDAVYHFLPPGTPRGDTTAAVVTGRVVSADAFGATVVLERDIPLTTLRTLWAVETARAYGKTTIGIVVAGLDDDLSARLKSRIATYPLLGLSAAPDATYELTHRGDFLQIRRVDTQIVLDSLRYTDRNDLDLTERLLALARAELLRGLDFDSGFGRVEVRIEQSDQPAATLPQIKVGTAATLVLTNPGDQPLFVAIADIQPDGGMGVVLPDADRGFAEFRLAPHQTRSVPLRVSPPFGPEMYKLFLTSEFMDLSSMLGTRGQVPSGHPLNLFFRSTFRGQSPKVLDMSQVSVQSYAFRIVPK